MILTAMKKTSTSVSETINGVAEPQPPSAAPCVELLREKGVEEEEEEEEEETLLPQAQEGPKLDDGFYEIETIRRKRVRKGQLQYLIKWRGWPETANTWEPLDNLQSVPDVIDAFEDSLKSGKHRKRKRKHVDHHTQPNKRHQRSTTSYSLRHFPTSTTDNHPQSAPPNDLPAHPQTVIFADDEGETNGDPKQAAIVNGFANTSKQAVVRNEENDYDPKLSELKATTNSGVDADKLAIHFQQAKVSTGNTHIDGQSKGDCVEPVQDGRCRGAKRRKSGSVKRFKKETFACDPADTHKAISMSVGTVEPGWTGIAGYMGNNSHKKTGDAKTPCNIVKIIKPIGYSASLSSNIQDVLVTFMAMRSDGTEVMVDNRYLKAYNPLLLINFYEQRLLYSPTL
ncbi:chromo domain-containing protein LHP1 [Gastrolobium bilobum]|uniref:chromo domain-containing protein LHP1 n=1 Tax=Gastrolobium bilobum TaxID=150636 RepID=UPI002AAF5467|nr:chromo domain-containing protein LHP1 [Gastrolobium bilobum]